MAYKVMEKDGKVDKGRVKIRTNVNIDINKYKHKL